MLESPFRSLVRLLPYFLFTLALMPVQVAVLKCHRGLAAGLPVFYHRWCCRLLGFHVVLHGEKSRIRPTLFVSNHSSYVDITILGSLIAGSFVAKAEVAGWPFFGTLARLQRTVFVDRRGANAAAHRDDLLDRLDAGDNLILFPEGTSDDGIRVLPFKSALFGCAEREVGGVPVTVQPVSIAYTRLDGMPVGRAFKPHFAWYGDMEMLSHMFTLIGLGTTTVEVIFHPPVDFSGYGSRKALAEHCFAAVAGGVAAANAGQPYEPARALPPQA